MAIGRDAASDGDGVNEKTLQNGIREHLWKAQGLRSYTFAAVGTHGEMRGEVPTGWPDVLVIVPAMRQNKYTSADVKHIYFEIKTKRGKPTKGQPEMQAELREQGCRVELIQTDDVEEGIRMVEAVLGEEGVALRSWW